MEERLNNPSGPLITRINYNRPKWFGGMLGEPKNHNTSGNCRYPEDLGISAEDLNKLLEPIYTMTPVLAYHLAITIFVALSVLVTLLQQGYNYLI